MSFPLRYQFTVALVGLNIVGTAAMAGFAYRASRNSLEQQAAQAVSVVAQERDKALVQLLQRRQQRMNAFLQSVESLCGERTPRGTYGFELGCVRMALAGFRNAERVTAANLSYGGRRLTSWGAHASKLDTASGEQAGTAGLTATGGYTMHAERDLLVLRARFPLDEIDAIFQDRSGLAANGEVLLADPQGRPITRPRYSADMARTVLSNAVQPCLAGTNGQAVTRDYRGVEVLSGFRPVSALGGGCIVANVQYADFVAPIRRLGRLFLWASLGLILAGLIISLLIARATTKPLAKLAGSARALEAGQFDHAVPVGGPTEVQQLGRALSNMARSIGNLVQSEHAARVASDAANRTKDDFLAMVSHELRTPLTAILGWVSITRNHPDDEAVSARALHAIERSARAQGRLIDDLLDTSRIVTGHLQLKSVRDVSLSTVADAVLESVRPVAEGSRVQLDRHVAAGALMVSGDADRLQQVVTNLLSNAVRFTPEGGRIDLSIDEHDDTVELRVADTGIGIDPEFLPHVFERFSQADTSTTRTYGGLGLGLSIAKQLVELHGGTLRADSPGLGHGATFTVTLPAASSPAALAQTSALAATPSVPPLLEGTRVMVVDDDDATRGVIRAILEDAGASVTALPSASEARAYLQHAKVDVMIADVGMPKEDGNSLMRSVRALESEDDPHIAAIALTAHARRQDEQEALASGFQMYVAKPVDSSELLSAVTNVLVSHLTH